MITLACPEHPKYKAVRLPRSTVRHSAGCECCWHIYWLVYLGTFTKHPIAQPRFKVTRA